MTGTKVIIDRGTCSEVITKLFLLKIEDNTEGKKL